MSAFVVAKSHIDALVSAWCHWHRDTGGDFTRANEIGAMLLRENIRSVEYRYRGDRCGMGANLDPETYEWTDLGPVFPIVAVIKAIHCYEYQSCEHDEWEGSQAQQWCVRLLGVACHRLPGYSDAAWDITNASEFRTGKRAL